MRIENTRMEDVRGAGKVIHMTVRAHVDTPPAAQPSATTPPEWFDAVDALGLLNSMVKRMRTRPCAKPLVRW